MFRFQLLVLRVVYIKVMPLHHRHYIHSTIFSFSWICISSMLGTKSKNQTNISFQVVFFLFDEPHKIYNL